MRRPAPGYVMLFYYSNQLCIGFLLLMLFFYTCAVYAYHVNIQRPADDPKKRNYHRGAIILAPFTWLLFFFASVTIFILRVFVYTMFLVLFTVAFLVIRKLFLLIWLEKITAKIGDKLLAANTLLIKIVFGKKTENPQVPS